MLIETGDVLSRHRLDSNVLEIGRLSGNRPCNAKISEVAHKRFDRFMRTFDDGAIKHLKTK
jgi:hypothetical protein